MQLYAAGKRTIVNRKSYRKVNFMLFARAKEYILKNRERNSND